MNNTDNYLNDLKKLANKFSGIDIIDRRIAFVDDVVDKLSINKIPSVNFYSLVFTEKEILEVVQQTTSNNFEEVMKDLEELDNLLSYFRQFLQKNFGYWATITEPFMESFIEQFKCETYLELMAGNGYISKYLIDNGKQSFATDSTTWAESSQTGQQIMTDIEKLDAIDAFEKYAEKVDAIILAWSPDFDEIDYQILEKYRKMNKEKPLFFVLGEYKGATNSDKFWDNVNFINNKKLKIVNDNYLQYDIVKDKLYLIN